MNLVMISIHPKWCGLIASGEKTVEIRRTRPKFDTPFMCYIYCTKERSKNALHLYTCYALHKLPSQKARKGKT